MKTAYSIAIYVGDTRSNFLNLTINVLDVDDLGVEFEHDRYNCSILENVSISFSISDASTKMLRKTMYCSFNIRLF